MNFMIGKNDSAVDLIKKRILFFRGVYNRYSDSKVRSICQAKICALEMVLRDVQSLNVLKHKEKL